MAVSIHLSLIITLLDCIIKAVTALWLRSGWIGSIAFYDLLLGVMRYSLARSVRLERRDAPGLFRFYGRLLLPVTLALTAMSFHMLIRSEAARYPGFLIYAAAVSTFYHLTIAIVNLVRRKSRSNPVYFVSNLLSLATAGVSLLFLQVSLLLVFGANEPWEPVINFLTAAAVFYLVLSMAVYLIRRGKQDRG